MAGVDNNILYSLVRGASGLYKLLAPQKSYWPEFLGRNTHFFDKTGTLYNKIYLIIFRTLIKIDTAAEITFLTNNKKRVFVVF